ncbi:Hsp70 family protein [Halobacteriovorax sp. HLS]|uniref:Hsp70 family protein n=1 Tax=Halobacteriovorax sp. HLS TaxID=2234000 RepID=UPI000FDA3531|nr:Hsp70 family protein [Halobacteriovorax sp. HLS]
MAKVIKYTLDFGTSSTLLGAITELGHVSSIPLDFKNDDNHIMKSLIYTPSKHEWYFGNECYGKYLELEGEGRFFRSFKTLLSRESFESTMIHGEKVSVESLIARFLREVRHRANSFYQQDVTSVRVGRPVRFGETLKSDQLALKRLTKALELAGFTNIEFIYEPVAAAKASKEVFNREKLVLIADIGAGTSDFSVIKFKSSKFNDEDILSISGVNVGGDSFDYELMKNFILPELGSLVRYSKGDSSIKHGISKVLLSKICSPAIFSLINDAQIYTYIEDALDNVEDSEDEMKLKNMENLFNEKLGFDLMKEIEKCKIELSKLSEKELSYCKRGVKIKKSLSQKKCFELSQTKIEEIRKALQEALDLAGVNQSDIDSVMCTGGGVQNPMIMAELQSRFNEISINLDQVQKTVVMGMND